MEVTDHDLVYVGGVCMYMETFHKSFFFKQCASNHKNSSIFYFILPLCKY